MHEARHEDSAQLTRARNEATEIARGNPIWIEDHEAPLFMQLAGAAELVAWCSVEGSIAQQRTAKELFKRVMDGIRERGYVRA